MLLRRTDTSQIGTSGQLDHLQQSGSSCKEQMKKVDIIWNVTLVCPWDCAICCVDAVHVTKRQGTITMRSRALTKVEQISSDQRNHFEQAMM